MTERYLVTGAGGFVGSFVVKELLSRGKQVRAMVRPGTLEKHATVLKDSNLEFVEADLNDYDSLVKATSECVGVFHLAALFRQVNVPDEEYHNVNVRGVEWILKASIASGVRRVIHCSTIGVVSSIEKPPGDETLPYSPGDIYQVSKVEGEKVALRYFREGRIGGVVIRPAMIYGPGDSRTRKLFEMIRRRRFFYVGSGDILVHWIDVRDLARAFCQAMEHSERNGEVYIIAGEKSLTLKEFVNVVARELGVPSPWLHLPVKPMQWLGVLCEFVCRPFGIAPPLYKRRVDFFIKNRGFNVTKAAKHLGFAPAKGLNEEIREILQSYKVS
jgi:dihydroflavonol-4-reductase